MEASYTIEAIEGGIGAVGGFYCGATNVGLREGSEQGDLAYIRSEIPCDVAALFTQNRFAAAPIKHFRRYGKGFQTDFVLINAKNANAMTGEKGVEDIDVIFEALERYTDTLNPIMSSTGVIGYRLPVEKIVSGFEKLDFFAKDSDAAARAIMTTDSFKKELAYEVHLENGESFRIAAIAKGAGMINPQMATMLCFIVTDADVPSEAMHTMLQEGAEQSFNRISVDGDMSTNDTVMLLCNRESGNYHEAAFKEALHRMMFELAMMILRDGEGASKTVAFHVKGAADDREARIAAEALSNSLLVKTALFGEDPNWGRIASTIGACGVACDEEKLSIYYDDLVVYDKEHPELDAAREAQAHEIMKQSHFMITCDLGMGEGSYTAYGCDLSYDYVKINAEYRT